MAGLTSPRPLAVDDNRLPFDCGRESLNKWFCRNAWHNQVSGASRIRVMCDAAIGTIAGYVSLSAAQIERAHLSKPDPRNQPDPLPALLLGQLAVDQQFQRQGCARSLMFFALTTAVRISKDIGCFCVITHPLDETVRSFYHSFGFEDYALIPAPAWPSGSLIWNTAASRFLDPIA
jgi:GNAT superfamily N-acetyltransferase